MRKGRDGKYVRRVKWSQRGLNSYVVEAGGIHRPYICGAAVWLLLGRKPAHMRVVVGVRRFAGAFRYEMEGRGRLDAYRVRPTNSRIRTRLEDCTIAPDGFLDLYTAFCEDLSGVLRAEGGPKYLWIGLEAV